MNREYFQFSISLFEHAYLGIGFAFVVQECADWVDILQSIFVTILINLSAT